MEGAILLCQVSLPSGQKLLLDKTMHILTIYGNILKKKRVASHRTALTINLFISI